MDAVEYLKAKGRMTNGCKYSCDECPLSSENNGINRGCAIFEVQYPEQAIEIVEKWAKENPVKTYLSVLLEKLPNVTVAKDGIPVVCLNTLFGGDNYCLTHTITCKECWNREYKEEE